MHWGNEGLMKGEEMTWQEFYYLFQLCLLINSVRWKSSETVETRRILFGSDLLLEQRRIWQLKNTSHWRQVFQATKFHTLNQGCMDVISASRFHWRKIPFPSLHSVTVAPLVQKGRWKKRKWSHMIVILSGFFETENVDRILGSLRSTNCWNEPCSSWLLTSARWVADWVWETVSLREGGSLCLETGVLIPKEIFIWLLQCGTALKDCQNAITDALCCSQNFLVFVFLCKPLSGGGGVPDLQV